jgi:hypothetical protein
MKTGSKRSKYGARKSIVDGITFDSQAEATRYTFLRHMQRMGTIGGLQLQVRYRLMAGDTVLKITSPTYPKGRAVTYVADFVYTENGKTIIEDVKGMQTPVYKLKKAIMAAMGHEIREHKGRG